jgi:hypothetical protein
MIQRMANPHRLRLRLRYAITNFMSVGSW